MRRKIHFDKTAFLKGLIGWLIGAGVQYLLGGWWGSLIGAVLSLVIPAITSSKR